MPTRAAGIQREVLYLPVSHARLLAEADYRATIRSALATAVERAQTTGDLRFVPTLQAVHEPSGSCCSRERWAVSEARLLGALQAAAPSRRKA